MIKNIIVYGGDSYSCARATWRQAIDDFTSINLPFQADEQRLWITT